MTNAATITISGPNDGAVLDVLGAGIRVQSSGRADQMFFADHPVPPHYEVPLHAHRDEDELFYVIEGEITLISASGEAIAGPGSFVHLPRGIAHGFANRSDTPAHMLVVTTPGNALFGAFTEMDRAAREGRIAPPVVAEVLAANRIDLV